VNTKEWFEVDLTEINYDADEGLALMIWYDIHSQKWIRGKFTDVLLFRISNAPKEMQPTFIVDVSLIHLTENDISEKLKKLGYGFIEYEPLNSAYHIHAEGSNVLDIVCEGIQLDEYKEQLEYEKLNI